MLMNTADYPGTPRHQALLEAIVSCYRKDPRILAIAVFGSLSRGNWDHYSDLDLDILIADDVRLDALEELQQLCDSFAAIDEHSAVIVPDGEDAGDVVFESLMQMSIRYHPIATTNPKIVDTLQVLAGRIDSPTIAAPGLANQPTKRKSFRPLLDGCVRYLVVADVALQRRHLWGAVEMLHRIRGLFMELYALAQGGERAMHFFQTEADPALQAQLGRTLPHYHLASVQDALEQCLVILEQDLGQLTKGQVQLTNAHRKVLKHVRARQARLRNGG